MKNHIYIYQDEGASALSYETFSNAIFKCSSFSHLKVQTINAQQLLSEGWDKDCALFVLPGGRDLPYHKKLKGKGNQKLRHFVENGGSFLGICAGAYYATSEVIFEKGKKNEVHENRELGFFPGSSLGTLYEHKPFSYIGHESAHAACIKTQQDSLKVYYNGGCTFLNPEGFENTQVLAKYQDLEGCPAAIIQCSVGKGKAILSGVHFEQDYTLCPSNTQLYNLLKDNEPKRLKLFESLINSLL